MALDFNGSSQYAWRAEAIVTAYPLTIACWFNVDSTAASNVLAGIGTAGTDNAALMFTDTNGKLRAFSASGGSNASAITATSVSTGTWHHGCAVFTNATDRRIYLNGGNQADNTTNLAFPASANRTYVGAQIYSGGVTNFTNGRIAEVAMWNVNLSSDEVAALGKGFSPLLIRPASLVAYWPMLAGSSKVGGSSVTTIDRWKTGYDLTEVATPTLADHPRIILPTGPIYT
jgi:hypothetical protein